ncbi:MAG: hypothetical protein KF764_10320 [Labilithrix sp.]|nr:hypothetical protein [Labilithrix sp.]
MTSRAISVASPVAASSFVGILAAFVACVPTGSAPPYDAGPTPAQTSSFKPSIGVMTAPFEDNFDRPDGGEALALPGDASSTSLSIDAAIDAQRVLAINDGGADAFMMLTQFDAGSEPAERPERARGPSNLGPDWMQMRTSAWRIENGRLCGENARNHGVWLNRTLPVNARIEFDAIAMTEDGDLKAEVWGDGHSYATGTSYTNATSYLAILGGWKNTLHVLARLNEHGNDRKVIAVDKESDDPRQRAVVRGQVYQFKIERTDGKTIRWSVDGVDYLSWNDPAPLAGQQHDHLGFNEWEAKVCFDNVKVTPL